MTALAAAVAFVLGYAATRPADPCPVCGRPATTTGLCALCASVVPPGRRTHEQPPESAR
ncbi:hypothetical protein [Mycobacterium sp. 29Ha]|uniref:hypothetical protein n=1 Tax=Mycobacterium sp. 29Ha TaxID=2939268 RepID=UPI0029391062|nr:hypothetical protein [Mycobacterium sp. 29Ha]MDV3136752.1 hypothetical protein [Mycobacterium sp. 29Ha]